MGLPEPVVGLVINFPYLWVQDQEAGMEQGKHRPCVIVSTIHGPEIGTKVLVAPITHSEPDARRKTNAVELPEAGASRLNLDRSWIICDECNEFIWPSADLGRVYKSSFNQFAYGIMGGKTMKKVRGRFENVANGNQIRVVSRM